MKRRRSYRRRAGMYAVVLATATIVTILGLSALTAVRVQRRAAEGTHELAKGRLYARSAIEMGLLWIEEDPNWRKAKKEGFWAVDQPIADGTFSLEVNDLGANKLLENSADTDAVLLTGTGFKGDARYKLQVTLAPQFRGLDCLEVALDAGGNIILFWMTLTCDQTVSANGSIIATNASGASDLEAVGSIAPSAIVGTQTTLSDPRTLPDSTVFDYYVDAANGTTIDINALEQQGSTALLRRVVLSPASNPFGGPLNAKGVYVINCGGRDIYIQDCRIVGTLVLLNPGPGSDMFFAVNWEPAVANYPALLVSGDMRISLGSAPLWESNATGSFNPPGTPYNGVEDTNTTQSYPSVIKGLVYVSGNMTISNDPLFDGVVVVGGNLDAPGNMSLTYQPTFLNNPPPGFGGPPMMVLSPGSWRQVVGP